MPDTHLPGYDFVLFILESLCEDKDQLVLEERRDELGILLTIKVSDRDMGKLIGRGGQTVKALRTLVHMVGGNTNERINLKILEPENVPAAV
ncbi:MAG: KH domain-containing protein [Candidatus Peregrinibacteria bacterium]